MRRWVFVACFAGLVALAQFETQKPYPGHSRVKLVIRDESGRPTGLRLRVTDQAGRYWAPLGFLSRPDAARRYAGNLILGDGQTSPLELHALVHDGAEIDLPFGKCRFQTRKGLEYAPGDQEFTVRPVERQPITLALKKYRNLESKGWIPGDTHMHFPDPAGIRYEMECEDLRVCSLLLLKSGYKDASFPGEGHFWNTEHFTGRLSPVSDARHQVQVGEEFRHGLLAHLIFQGLRSVVWPVSTGGLREGGTGGYDWPLMAHATAEARAQGALVTWAHWPYPSLEAPLDIALGRIDSLDILTTGSPFEHHPILVDIYKMHGAKVYKLPPIEVYYHYLNCGFRLAVSAGSDKMALNPPLGSARTYARVEGTFKYASWLEAIRRGRTFITTAPLVEFSVNGREPGATLRLAGAATPLRVRAHATSIEPYDVLEVLHNGRVVKSVRPSGERYEADIDEAIEVGRGGWLALRAHGRKMLPYGATWWQQPVFAHTSPVYLDMPGRPAEAGEAAALFLDQLGYLRRWAQQANFPAPANREETLRLIATAEDTYKALIRP
jgi:hypothetical protein